jgi:regulatory protein SWI6
VYEMEVNGVAVMRRRSDAWLNATQILKVAGVEKGKRTKVLEKEILTGEHEKVQGGYGKYQGTWINYRRGIEFCRQYGVEELLRPLLEYDMAPDGSSLGHGGIETPTKEQAMAAQRKRLYGTGVDNRQPTQSANGTFFKNISSAAVNAVNAISKARYESPGPRQMDGSRRPSGARRPSQQIGSQEFPGSQQSMLSMASQTSFTSEGFVNPLEGANGEMQEPPRKRLRPSSSQDPFGADATYDVSMHEATPTEPNESFVYHQHGFYPNVEDAVVGLDPLPQPHGKTAEGKQQLLMNLFLEPNQTDFSDHPALLKLSGEDLDIPLDQAANTALHWAATLARTHLLRALIAKGASIFRVNSGGESALLRACVARNNLDKGTFPELLELLGPTIEIRDGRGRTILHHIAISSSIRGRSGVGKYYLESLLEFVIRQGSAPSSQQNSFGPGMNSSQPYASKSISLARFIAEIVNARDKAGDTALNVAARIGNKGIVQQLLEVKADPYIANRGGLRPVDCGISLDGEPEQTSSSQQPISQDSSTLEKASVVSKVGETSREMMTSYVFPSLIPHINSDTNSITQTSHPHLPTQKSNSQPKSVKNKNPWN